MSEFTNARDMEWTLDEVRSFIEQGTPLDEIPEVPLIRRVLRMHVGLSRDTLAIALGVSRSTMWRVETLRIPPRSMEHDVRLLKFYGGCLAILRVDDPNLADIFFPVQEVASA